jgi:UDP-glucose 4-epimerase
MKVLVTGGSGFIGRYVEEMLRYSGHDPILFDRKKERATFLGDIMDSNDVTEGMAQAEGFIHLAGILGTQETIQNPRPAIETNILGSLNILEAAAQYKIPGVCIGIGNHFMENPYSISKSTVERLVRMYNAERGTKINIVRPMNAYGPRQKPSVPYGTSKVRKLIPALVCRALNNHPIELYGDGSQVSDMVYVEDVADALVRALESAYAGKVFDKVVEVGPEDHQTVLQTAEMVKEIAGSKSKIVFLPMRPGEKAGASVAADVTTLDLIGMSAKHLIPLRVGLEHTVEYYRKAI